MLLGALVALPALGTDFFVPALPALAHALGAPVDVAQFTLTTFFIGLAAGQLAWGPLSDRFGRRPVLLAGLALMLAASAGAIAARSVGELAALRLVQGLGMSSGAVIARAVVRDLYAHEAAARMLAAVTIVFSIVPLTAPLAGALISEAGGWPAIFWGFSAAAAALILAAGTGLRETAPTPRRSLHPVDVARTFAGILGERRFVAPYLLMLCCHVGILSWVSNSAFTLIGGMGVSATAYGLMFAIVASGQIAGAWWCSRLVLRLGMLRLVRLGVVLMLLAGAAAAALAWSGVTHWSAVVLPFLAFMFASALILPNATAMALTPFPQAAGSAASLMGAIGFTAGALISTALGAVFDGTARPMASVALVAGAGAFLFERYVRRGTT